MLPLVALTLVSLVLLLLAEARGPETLRWIAKPLASTGFVLVAVAAGAGESAYGRALLAALALCWLGDVLLLWRVDLPFKLGLASFLLGHVVLVLAFALRGIHMGGFAAAAVLLVPPAIGALRWLRPHVPPSFVLPVRAYVVAISVMLAAAAGAWVGGARGAVLWGALLFYLSDLCVARDRFVTPGFDNRAVGLPLYYAATLVLASTAGGS